jgi:hypothetical protein
VKTFYNSFVPYERYKDKIMTDTYFPIKFFDEMSEMDTTVAAKLEAVTETSGLRDPYATLLIRFMEKAKEAKSEWRNKSLQAMIVGYAETGKRVDANNPVYKKQKEEKTKEEKTSRPLENYDGNQRTKLLLWILLLETFMDTPYECSRQLIDTLVQKRGEALKENARKLRFTAVFHCISNILKRSQLPCIRQESKDVYGETGKLIYYLSLLADYSYSQNSLDETRRFLHKLPGCNGDIAETYIAREEYHRTEHRYLPLNGKVLTMQDVTFVTQVIHRPAEKLFNYLKDTTEKLNGKIIKSLDIKFAEKTKRKNHKAWKYFLIREINTAWMKIANCVGSIVYPTEGLPTGKQRNAFDKIFAGLPQICFAYYVY